MAPSTLVQDALSLPPADRLALIDQLWESLQMDGSVPSLSAEQQDQLERRADEMRRDPTLGSSWDDVKARVWPK